MLRTNTWTMIVSALCFTAVSGISANFEGDTELLSKQFYGTDFSDADLQGVNLNVQNLSNADFRGTNLSGASMLGTILTKAKMNSETDFTGAIGWEGKMKIIARQNSIDVDQISGKKILITKEWLINQGVIFEK